VSLPLTYGTDEALLYALHGRRPLIVLAGHLDTVPAQDNLPGRIENGCVIGLGASDMKGGVAVMIELAAGRAEAPDSRCDLAFLFFVREELPAERARCRGCSRRRRSCSSRTWS
jgi:acetylornithine deacetylase/succinyl-diaminopimelate desuccinylase-like protein